MANGSGSISIETLRRHLDDAEREIADLKSQIAERKSLSIPTLVLQEALAEATKARDGLRLRLQRAEENSR